ncbi:MAG: signal peptidase II [Ruminococcaceae bacterium]|nr:signal peptidase II [Oscillospiraceae bacterium]
MTVLIVIASVLLDQITKYLAVKYVQLQGSMPLIKGVFNFTYHENRGAFLGSFADNRWVFLIASSVAIVAMVIYLLFVKDNHILVKLSLSMLIGGGIGNMIDRVSLGYVIDFLDFELINFPIFNIADSFITVGAGLLIVYLIFFEMRNIEPKKKTSDIKDFDIPLRSEDNSSEPKEDVVIESGEVTDVSDNEAGEQINKTE